MKRSGRGGRFYCVDTETRARVSLGTSDEDAARQIVQAKNQALRQPALNLQIAKAYLAGPRRGNEARSKIFAKRLVQTVIFITMINAAKVPH